MDLSRVRLTAGSALGLFMTGMIGAAPGGVLPQWQSDLGIGNAVSYYFTLFFVAGLMGTLAASHSRVRHPWLSLGLVSEAAGMLLIATAPGLLSILLAAIFLSLGVATINYHANSLPGELYAEGSIVIINRVNAAFGVGAVVSPLLVVLLPWRWAFVWFAVMALIGAAMLWQAPPPQRQREVREARERAHLLPLTLLAVVAYVAVEVVTATFSGVYLRYLGYDQRFVGILLSVHWGMFALGRMFLAPLVAANALLRIAFLAGGAVVAALFYWVPTLAWLFPLVGFLISPIFPSYYSFTQNQIGYFALAYLFYAGAAGGTLIPALFARLEVSLIPLGILLATLVLAGLSLMLVRAAGSKP